MKLFSILVLFSALISSSFASVPQALVKKNDGSVVKYKLLPVKHDPLHARIVENRLKSVSKVFAKKSSYQIPTSSLPAIRDQGQRGTCAYFATVGLLETYYMAQPNTACCLKISEECLVDLRNWEYDTSTYTGADKPDARPDPNGDLPNSIAQTIMNYGVPEAKNYGTGDDAIQCVYNGDNQSGGSVSLDQYGAATKASKPYGEGLKFDLNNAPTIDTVKELIAANIPVEVGILVYYEMLDGGSDWKFNPKVDTEYNIAGGHAIMLVGYETKGSKTVFTFKNSWGTSWGKSGYGTIDDGLLKNAWAYDPAFDFTTAVHN